jgi:anti-sigma-K factor RskA
MSNAEYEAEKARLGEGQSEEDIQTAIMKHEAGDAERRWREEKAWHKGRWWRWVNRIMSVIGVLVVAAVVSFLSFFSSWLSSGPCSIEPFPRSHGVAMVFDERGEEVEKT